MTQHHKYPISDLENLYPFEIDVYAKLLENHLEEQRRNEQQII